MATRRTVLLVCVALATSSIGAGCNRHDDDRSIKPAPEQAAPSSIAPIVPPPVVSAAPDEVASNPLAMRLKHDGPDPVGAPANTAGAAAKDPCALDQPQPTGPLAMRLRHDRPNAPGARNPLCMRLK